jgi:hypothetical protein
MLQFEAINCEHSLVATGDCELNAKIEHNDKRFSSGG